MTNIDRPDGAAPDLIAALPSARMRAATWYLKHGKESHLPALKAAESAESVPRIRATVTAAIRSISRSVDSRTLLPQESAMPRLAEATSETLNRLSGVIRHELSMAIGWLIYTATKEIEQYEASETNAATRALRRRVDGLVSIAQASKMPETVSCSLGELVHDSIPPQLSKNLVHVDEQASQHDQIVTDEGLLSLILLNAFQNALEASDPPSIFVTYAVTDRDFWITITNVFDGVSFDLQTISASGVTTKVDHRGIGTYIMRLAAERLSYEVSLDGAGGVATFSLRGKRTQ